MITDITCEKVIKRGNIINSEYNESAEVGRYIANGRFGTVIGGLGLNMSPSLQAKYSDKGQTQYVHLNHWGRFRFVSDAMNKETVSDYILPLFKIYWENEPQQVSDYNQTQDFYDGTVTTSYTIESKTNVTVQNWFDMENKDLAGVQIDISKGIIPIKIAAVTDFLPYEFLYKKRTSQTVSIEQTQDNWCITISCGDTINKRSSKVYIHTNMPVEKCGEEIRILASEGRTNIYVSYGKPVDINDTLNSLQRTITKWHEKWNQGGWFNFPEDTTQKIWIRSNAYIISSYDDDLGPIQSTNGLTGNLFPFHFVQDMEYIRPGMMMLGNEHIAKRWVEKFASSIPEMQQYAKHLWPKAKGIYPPWELPYGEIEGYHTPSVPVVYCYEPHNSGYLCRLAKETADFINDEQWARKFAYPLIREISEFYKAFAHKKEDGWHLEWFPCIGQDEAGGRNKKDYLCTMYSAYYTFQIALECGLDEDGTIQEIIKDGLAFESLMSEHGTYRTCQGADDFGKQKHPVQLDGVAYFPIFEAPLKPELKAYEVRYDITEDAKKPFFHGWTLSEFLLSGSNTGNVDGWKMDWSNMRKANYADSEWVQIYETSGQAEKSFYVTNHGMILQSLIRNYVNDYWGHLDIAACPVFDDEVIFKNIKTRLGVIVSGKVNGGDMDIELEATRDCNIKINGIDIKLKKGEKKHYQEMV